MYTYTYIHIHIHTHTHIHAMAHDKKCLPIKDILVNLKLEKRKTLKCVI